MKIPLPGLTLLVLALNMVLCAVHFTLLGLVWTITDNAAALACGFIDCYAVNESLLVMTLINLQLFWLALGWLAGRLGRNGLAWLGATTLGLLLLCYSAWALVALDWEWAQLCFLVVFLFLQPLQLAYLVVRGRRELHRLYSE